MQRSSRRPGTALAYVWRHDGRSDTLLTLRSTYNVIAGSPIELVQPDTMRFKVMEPLLLLGKARHSNLDIRLRVKGGGHVSQCYGASRAGTFNVHLCAAII